MTSNSIVHKNEESLSYYIEVKNKYDMSVFIPVVDVRDGPEERALATEMIKGSNSSKYLMPNQYNRPKQ